MSRIPRIDLLEMLGSNQEFSQPWAAELIQTLPPSRQSQDISNLVKRASRFHDEVLGSDIKDGRALDRHWKSSNIQVKFQQAQKIAKAINTKLAEAGLTGDERVFKALTNFNSNFFKEMHEAGDLNWFEGVPSSAQRSGQGYHGLGPEDLV